MQYRVQWLTMETMQIAVADVRRRVAIEAAIDTNVSPNCQLNTLALLYTAAGHISASSLYTAILKLCAKIY